MLVCRDIPHRWASDDLERGQRGPSLALRMHLMICRNCRRYIRELVAIRQAARELATDDANRQEKFERRMREMVRGNGEGGRRK